MNKNASNPFLVYSQADSGYKVPAMDLYRDSINAFVKTSQKPKQKVFNSMAKLLQESFLIGATKYGNNFIG